MWDIFIRFKHGEKHLYHRRWKDLKLLKKAGKLSFRDLHIANLSLFLKQEWKLMAEPELLWRKVIHGNYYNNKSFFKARSQSPSSAFWKRIMKCRSHLLENSFWSRVNGHSIQIFQQRWIPHLPSNLEKSANFEHNIKTVHHLLDTSGRRWNSDWYPPISGRA